MRITRQQLRRLIAESYTPKVPRGLPPNDPGPYKGYRTDLSKPIIDYYRAGLTQIQINDVVDEYFHYNPKGFAGALSQDGMSLRDIAEEIFDYCLTGPGIGSDALLDHRGNIINPDHVEEVIRRYEVALSRPHHMELGHIS